MKRLVVLVAVVFLIGLISCGGSMSTAKGPKKASNMVELEGGSFTRGIQFAQFPIHSYDAPTQRISVSPFAISRFEITNEQYKKFLESSYATGQRAELEPDSSVWSDDDMSDMKNYFYNSKFSDYPVVGVSWRAANAFCDWMQEESDGKYIYRLPTEAEWEYAARGGLDTDLYPWGNELRCEDGSYLANYKVLPGDYPADGYLFPAPVGAYPPNDYGLYDMAGNVSEWCIDTYHFSSYVINNNGDVNPVHEPRLEANGTKKVIRGGDWNHYSRFMQCGYRRWADIDYRASWIGFRIVRIER